MQPVVSKILYNLKLKLNDLNDSYNEYISLRGSREKAKKFRLQLLAENGETVVNNELLMEIKEYCRSAFGSEAYWPWLALYAEIKGEFKRGWVPDEYYRFKLLSKMNPKKFREISQTKSIDYKLFNDSIIEPLLFRSNGQYCSKDGTIISESDVYRLLQEFNEEIIIKPDNNHGGKGIGFKHARDIRLDDLPADTDLIFQIVLKQHAELRRLYPSSINTFRVLTFIDSDGNVNIKFIYLRFGRGGNRVDNGASGGGWVFVHLNGQVEPMAYDTYGAELGTLHPDTGIKYADLAFPFLQKVITLCKKTHQTFPYVRIIGWDVFINENEEAKLIEWNAEYPGFWAVEARFGPFFDEVVNA